MVGIIVMDVKPQAVIGMRSRGSYRDIPLMIRKLVEFAVSRDVKITGGPIFLWHEKSVEEAMKADREGSADLEVAFPIREGAEGTDEMRFYELPGGEMARIIHKGPYEEAGPCYEEIFSWVEKNGRKLSGPLREVYLNDPREVPPEEILTEIYAPLE